MCGSLLLRRQAPLWLTPRRAVSPSWMGTLRRWRSIRRPWEASTIRCRWELERCRSELVSPFQIQSHPLLGLKEQASESDACTRPEESCQRGLDWTLERALRHSRHACSPQVWSDAVARLHPADELGCCRPRQDGTSRYTRYPPTRLADRTESAILNPVHS